MVLCPQVRGYLVQGWEGAKGQATEDHEDDEYNTLLCFEKVRPRLEKEPVDGGGTAARGHDARISGRGVRQGLIRVGGMGASAWCLA